MGQAGHGQQGDDRALCGSVSMPPEALDATRFSTSNWRPSGGLRFRYRPTRAWTHSDPQLLRRVLQNFLANAVRYTERGSVLLGVRRIDGGWLVDVLDTGPGIPAST